MTTLHWVRDELYAGFELHGLPLWIEGRCPEGMRVMIWIEPRPPYCDRGRWLAKTDAPLDGHDGWPRYYHDLGVAMAEVERWVAGRAAFQHE